MNPRPAISLVVVELSGESGIRACLDRLLAAPVAAELLLVSRGRQAPDGAPAEVRVISDAGSTVPERRLTAVRSAQSDWIALIEDTTLVSREWLAGLSGLTQEDWSGCEGRVGALWGPVHVVPRLPARFRALAAMEYGRFNGTAPVEGTMPGNCMLFRRSALLEVIDDADDGIVEHAVVPRLQTAGWSVLFHPGMISRYVGQDEYGARLSTRFSHGRLFAARRHPRSDRSAHLRGAVRAFLVPVVLTLRAARHILTQNRSAARAVSALAWAALMSVAWGAGEFTGHLVGEGKSGESWR